MLPQLNVEMIGRTSELVAPETDEPEITKPHGTSTEPGNLQEPDPKVLSVPKSDDSVISISEGQLSLDIVSASTTEAYLSQKVQECNCSFIHDWLDQHKWLCYSAKLNGAFCMPCLLFNGMSSSTGKVHNYYYPNPPFSDLVTGLPYYIHDNSSLRPHPASCLIV